MGLVVGIFNKIISLIGGGLSAILFLLPNSPFSWDISGIDNSFLKIIFWIIPIQQILASLEAYILSVGLYYAVRTILRWAKVAGE